MPPDCDSLWNTAVRLKDRPTLIRLLLATDVLEGAAEHIADVALYDPKSHGF